MARLARFDSVSVSLVALALMPACGGGGGGGVALIRNAPSVDPIPSATDALEARVAGQALRPNSTIRIYTPLEVVDAPVPSNRRFDILVDLELNKLNRLVVVERFADASESAPVAFDVIQDSSSPNLFVDCPPDGAQIASTTVSIAGRVGDGLSGHVGLSVIVNGIVAAVDRGSGADGCFFAGDVPLDAGVPTVVDVRALDAFGHEAVRSITVQHTDVGASTLSVVSGNNQSGTISTILPSPLVVEVTKGDGSPFSDKLVSFKVERGDGVLTDTPGGQEVRLLQVRTDAQGRAEAFWRVGGDAGCGNHRVIATSAGIQGSGFFVAAASRRQASQINLSGGNLQRGEPGGPLPRPLRVWTSDGKNAVADVPVRFRVKTGGGYFEGASGRSDQIVVRTDATGHAEARYVVGAEPGSQVITATFAGNAGMPVDFSETGVPRDATTPTIVDGVVLDNTNQPIEGASCVLTIAGTTLGPVPSASDGRFIFDDVPVTGPGYVHVDGGTAFHVGGSAGMDIPQGTYPSLAFEIYVTPNALNNIGGPVLLPQLDPLNRFTFDNTQDVTLTIRGIDGLKLLVKGGSMTRANGTRPSESDPETLTLNQVHVDKVPMPMPDGVLPGVASTLQPAGAHFDPPIEVTYPNTEGLPPGTRVRFFSYDHDIEQFQVVAVGQVSDDGSVVKSDPGQGIVKAGWHGASAPPPPTFASSKKGFNCNQQRGDTPCIPAFENPVSGGKKNTCHQGGVGSADYGSCARRNADGSCKPHDGIDITSQLPADFVFAVAPGRVISVFANCVSGDKNCGGGHGNKVVIEHREVPGCPPYYTLYAHLQDVFVAKGDVVATSQLIGTIGWTGNGSAACPHLHFEVSIGAPPRLGRHECDPSNYISELTDNLALRYGDGTESASLDEDADADTEGESTIQLFVNGVPAIEDDAQFFVSRNIPFTAGLVSARGIWRDGDRTIRCRTTYKEQVVNSDVSFDDLDLIYDDVAAPVSLLASTVDPVLVSLGQVTPMSVKGIDAFGNQRDVTSRSEGTTYRSSNADIVTVDNSGLVTAVAAGRAFVFAFNEGAMAAIPIDVSIGDPLTSLEGLVEFPDATPAVGATVLDEFFHKTTTVNEGVKEGFFRFESVPALRGAINLWSGIRIGGVRFATSTREVEPIPGGVADAGVLTLSESNNTVLAFDGSNDYVAIPTAQSLNPTTTVTLEAWVEIDSLPTPQSGIAGTWHDLGGANRTYVLWIWNSNFEFIISHDRGDSPRARSPVLLGEWTHVAGTFDGQYIRIYVNGILANEVVSPGSLATNSRPFYIGRTDTGGDGVDYFDGRIDEVRLWNVARTGEEIRDAMNLRITGTEAGLVGYWRLDDGGGEFAADATSNGNDGHLGNGVASLMPAWVVSDAPNE
jgi:murein DD-endopeptidase MepM/ murein hydrolase activator NlpD